MTILGSEGTGQSAGTQDSGNQGAANGTGNTQGNSGAGAGSSTGGNSSSSWRDSLPDDLKTNASLSHFKDVPSLAKSWISAQEMIGKKGVVIPGQQAGEAEWNAFYDSIGRPPLDKYELKFEKDKVNTDFVGKFKEAAHKAGVLPQQAQNLFDWYTKLESDALQAKLTETETVSKAKLQELQKEWGQGFDKNISLARLAVKEVGGPELQQFVEETGLGNDPKIIKFMAKVGAMLGEDKIRGEGGQMGGKTPAEVNKEIGRIMGDFSHPYHNAQHPGHKSAVSEMEGYFKQMG